MSISNVNLGQPSIQIGNSAASVKQGQSEIKIGDLSKVVGQARAAGFKVSVLSSDASYVKIAVEKNNANEAKGVASQWGNSQWKPTCFTSP